MDADRLTQQDLIRWSEALSAIARTGLAFTESGYERERYEEVLHVAADIRAAVGREVDKQAQVVEWMRSVVEGVPGYVTPKVAVGAVVGNEAGEILLIQRSDSGYWLYPTGWADIGYSPAEVAVKEVLEETGIVCEVQGLLGVLDGMRRGFTKVPLYSLLFQCRAVGGELAAHPLECLDAGFFGPDELPEPLAGTANLWELAFSAARGEPVAPFFDPPRESPWRVGD
ncbi:MAG: NUDIX domain-containing protein [Acidimicrobiia bacterium]|nr:NUDIX domain-containing protein [Acidimicrobiia bacterium]